MRLKFTCPALIVFIFSTIFFNGLQAQSNSNVIQFVSNNYEGVFATAIDSSDHIISVGDFTYSGYIQKPGQTLSGSDSFDAFIACSDKQGNILWKDIFGASHSTWATNVVCDHAGNCYVTGYFEKGFILDGVSFDSTNYYNAFLMKLDHNGKVIWGTSYGVSYAYISQPSVPHGLTCDADGNLYFDMVLFSPLKIKNQVFANVNSGKAGCLLAKFDINGNLVWGKALTNQYGIFSGVKADNYGHVYIGGHIYFGKTTWGGSNLPGLNDTASEGLFLAKLDASSGNMLWIQRCMGKTSYSEISYIEIGRNGQLYAGGDFADTLNIQGQNYYATPHKDNGDQDIMALSLDTSGKILWLQHFGEFYEPQYPNGFCMDRWDNVYIGASFIVPVTLGSMTLFSTIARDIYVIRFNEKGQYVNSTSSKAISNSSYSEMVGLMCDSGNNIFATGFLYGGTGFDRDTIYNTNPRQPSPFIWSLSPLFTAAAIDPEIKKTNNYFSVYPNPTNGNILNLEIENGVPKGNAEISCIDATGRLMFSKSINQSNFVGNTYPVQLPAMQPGLYFIIMVSEQGIYTQKLIRN